MGRNGRGDGEDCQKKNLLRQNTKPPLPPFLYSPSSPFVSLQLRRNASARRIGSNNTNVTSSLNNDSESRHTVECVCPGAQPPQDGCESAAVARGSFTTDLSLQCPARALMCASRNSKLLSPLPSPLPLVMTCICLLYTSPSPRD